MRWFAASLVLMAASVWAADPWEEESVRVDYVLLDVLAFDKQNRSVTDLALGDFVVSENGKKVKLQSLDLLDFREPPAVPHVDPSVPGNDPSAQFVIVLDLQSASRAEARKTFEQVERFLGTVSRRPDTQLMLYSMSRGQLLDGFVNDPARVLSALRRFRDDYLGLAPEEAPGLSAARDLVDLEARFESCRNESDLLPVGAQVATDQPAQFSLFDCIGSELAGFVALQEARTLSSMSDLEELAYRFGVGRWPVAMLFVSPGFSLKPGAAAVDLADTYYDRSKSPGALTDSTDPGPQWQDPLSTFPEPRNLKREFRRVVHACVKSRVVFHAFDMYNFNMDTSRKASAEVSSGSDKAIRAYREFKQQLTAGLLTLADESGGFFASATTLKPMQSVMDRSRVVYVLGYESPVGKPGDFRRIKVKCRRKRVELKYRTGYYGSSVRPGADSDRSGGSS